MVMVAAKVDGKNCGRNLLSQQKNKAPKYQGLYYGHWWRRRELNPRPQYLDHRIYMRSLSIGFNRATLRQTG
jgi:hypothetical protein